MMSLTGPAVLGATVGVTVLAFVALVAGWPRLAGRLPVLVAARVGALALVNTLVLLTAATLLNDHYLFFSDWTDLTGGTTASVIQRGSAATTSAARSVPGSSAATSSTVATAVPPIGGHDWRSGSVAYTVRGPATGLTGTVLVQVPAGYNDPANAGRAYPVLEAFPGYPGGPGQWASRMDLRGALDQGVAAGRVAPALVVSPQVELPAGVDTECVNGRPGNPQLETWVTRDVPDWVMRHFRVRTGRSSWASIGFSTGGWCAAMSALLHPARYSAAVVMGGYFRPELGRSYQPYPPHGPLAARYDLVDLVARRPPPVAIWLETSHADATSYPSSAALLKVTRAPLAVSATVLKHAGHRLSVWQGELPAVVAWLGADIPGFRPGAGAQTGT
jgi:enterochelin esterase-like enzyme